MRARWVLLLVCACGSGTPLSQANAPWLRVQGDAGVELVLGGPDCPALSPEARVTLNGEAGTVVRRGGKADACQGGCADALVRWPRSAAQLEFSVADDGRSLALTVDARAPHLTFALEATDGGERHLGFGAPLALQWEPAVPVERARIELQNPALMWRGGKPLVLCGPGKCVLPGADAGALLLSVPRSAMPGRSGLTATALFAPRVVRCEGASACSAELPATAASARGALIIDP